MQRVKHNAPWLLWLALGLLLGTLTACGGSKGPQIEQAELAKAVTDTKEPAGGTVSSFSPGDPAFHLAVKVQNAPADTKVKAIWWAVAAGESKNQKVDEAEVTVSDTRWVDFSLTRQTDTWPKGTYKVEIYLNGKLERTRDFTVS